jgi:glycosyltransferase involved in cell wall biosynthesis
VVACRPGSVAETVEHGRTGFVCDRLCDMVDALPKVRALDRAACRERVERHFSARAMADGYERIYRELIASRSIVTIPAPAPVTTTVTVLSLAPELSAALEA